MRELIRGSLALVGALAIALTTTGCGDSSGSDPDPVEEDAGPTEDSQVPEDEGPIVVPDLTAQVVASIDEGNAPLTTHLTCEVEGDEGAPLSYLWQIGEQKSSLPDLDFTFHTEGDYETCCKVWRDDGLANTAESCTIIRVKTSAELSITSPKITGPAEVAQGQCLSVTFTVANNGGRIDDPFDIRCVLSPNQDWGDGMDQHKPLKTFPIEKMDSGQFVTQVLEFSEEEMCIAEDVSDGSYFLLCKVDADDAVNEQNKADNAKFATTFIVVDGTVDQIADLQITALTISDQTFPKNWDDKVGYEVKIENTGEGDAEQFQYEVYLCGEDGELDDECLVIRQGTIFSMDALSVIPIIVSWTVPEGHPDGTYCMVAVADVQNQIAEMDEDNNQVKSNICFEVKFEEIVGIDLAVTSMSCAPEDAVWNGTLAVVMEVTNFGNVVTPNWDYEVYLSTAPAPTPATSWQLCKGSDCSNQPGLEPGITAEKTAVVTIPSDMPLQEYFCIVKLDPADEITEKEEGNNFAKHEAKVTVTAKAYTDVFVQSVSLLAPVAQKAGWPIKVQYEVGNADQSTAAGVKICVVLSADQKTSASEVKSGTDILLGSRIVQQLKPGTKTVETDKYTLPLALDHTVGSYYIGVVADCDGLLQNDTQKNNNWDMATDQLTVISPQGGCFEDDLEPNGTQELAAPLTEGLYENLGGCNDDDWYVVVVPETNTLVVNLSLEPTLSLKEVPFDLDLELVAADGSIVDVGKSTGNSDQVLAFVVPAQAEYFIRVTPKKSGMEAHYSLDVQMVPPLDGTDLFPAKAVAAPPVTFSGGALYMSWKLINLGTVPSGPFDVAVYLSADDALDLDGTDRNVGTIAVTEVPATTATERYDALILPTDVEGGTWNVYLQVDVDGVIEEVDEENNVAKAPPIVIDGDNPCVDDVAIFEPNNTLETATLLATETQVHEGLGVCPDLDDWYSIELGVGDRIEAHVLYTYKSAAGFLYLQIIDENGVAVLDEGVTSKDANIDLPYVWDAGMYYLRVFNPAKNNKALPYTYTLDITIEPGLEEDACTSDQFETSNDALHAAGVGCGLKQMTLCRKDVDWLWFSLPAGDSVDLTLENEGSKLKLEVFEDPEGKALLKLSGNGTTTVTAGDLPTTYYVRIDTKTAATKVTSFDYTIFFDGIAGVDLSVQDVTPLTGKVYQGEDEVIQFGIINQCLDTVPDVGFGLYLSEDGQLDEADTLIHTAPVGAPVEGKTLLTVLEKFTVPFETVAGVYSLIVVADYDESVEESNEGNNTASGPLQVLQVCIDDVQEPNNVPQLAPTVEMQLYESLQICPFDLDWYELELAEGEILTAIAAFVNADGDLDLRLYDDQNFFVPIVKAFETNDGEELMYVVPADGIYYLRVNGLSGASNSYDLEVILEAPADGGPGEP